MPAVMFTKCEAAAKAHRLAMMRPTLRKPPSMGSGREKRARTSITTATSGSMLLTIREQPRAGVRHGAQRKAQRAQSKGQCNARQDQAPGELSIDAHELACPGLAGACAVGKARTLGRLLNACRAAIT